MLSSCNKKFQHENRNQMADIMISCGPKIGTIGNEKRNNRVFVLCKKNVKFVVNRNYK